ncbi:MAG: hypothetical protein KF825_11905 [Ferruginibacter sp.]|nr:hypothetical protein [Ferruginibacter sp.]
MKLRKLTLSDYFLILVNLVPVYGVWYEGWNAAQVFLVYCLETVIIGVINVIKMACVTLFVKPTDVWDYKTGITRVSGLFFIVFFIFHYGFFVFVQTQIFFGVSGIINDSSIIRSYSKIPAVLGHDGLLLLLIFIAYYTLQTLFDFFLSGKYKQVTMIKLMFQPYGRIVVQQFVVIIGSMFLAVGFSNVFILILALVKTGFELFVNFERFIDKAEADAKRKMAAENKKLR